MAPRARLGLILLVASLLPGVAVADEEFEQLWSATLIGEFKIIADENEASDAVGGFFDQYEFVPNKSSSVPFELGILDASYDLLGTGQTPKVQFRLQSPTSNLGVSGSQVDQPFLNQRADLLGRFDQLDFDIGYHRFRTEELRLFPEPLRFSVPDDPQLDDLTSENDRFFRDRTGFESEFRHRLQSLSKENRSVDWLAPALSLRGAYDSREGKQQFRFLDSTYRMGSITQDRHQDVWTLGGGLMFAPGGLFTMALDYDYKAFRENAPPTLESDLGSPFPVIGFLPDTDQWTGTIRLNSRIGDRAVLSGGLQATRLEQIGEFTPAQQAVGLFDNSLLFYSANFAADVAIAQHFSANAYFKYDQRDNDIQRDTTLFNSDNQIDEFLARWRRIDTGLEIAYRPHRISQFALGGRFEWIDRDLDFAPPNIGEGRILPENALVSEKTTIYTVYGRTNVRPIKGMGVWAELGYRFAPDTGYITDLDRNLYGKLRASYAKTLWRPWVFSAFVEGGTGENRDFAMVEGQFPDPLGPTVDRDFDRCHYRWGLTVTSAATEDLTVFASYYSGSDAQDYDLVRSNLQRYYQDFVSLTFPVSGPLEFRSRDRNFTVGGHVQITKRTDAGLSYSFTRSKADYDSVSSFSDISLIESSSIVDSDIHGIQLEGGAWLMDGLRVMAGYRLQLLNDDAPVPSGDGSRVDPFDLSSTRHTVTFGVTLTSDLLASKD